MKKTLSVLLALFLVTSLAACGSGQSSQTADSATATEVPMGENFEFEGISVTLPVGFHMDDTQSITMAVSDNYPTETDNITFNKTNADNIDAYDAGAIDVAYTSAIEGYGGITDFEKTQIAGTDAIVMKFLANVTNVDMHITQALLFYEDRTVVVTFTDITGNYTDAFAKSLESIQQVQ